MKGEKKLSKNLLNKKTRKAMLTSMRSYEYINLFRSEELRRFKKKASNKYSKLGGLASGK